MRNCYVLAGILFAVFRHDPVLAEEHIGVRQGTAQSSVREEPLEFKIWYPAEQGGEKTELGLSPFFESTEAYKEAPIKESKYPLVLLSHGAGLSGRAEALAWLATGLAEAGYVVVAPTHPKNTGPDRSALETIKLWLRPKDVSDVLNVLERDTVFQNHIDWTSVAVVGASMGGTTALILAGMQIDSSKLASYCDDEASNPSLCGWLRASEVNLHTIDLKPAELNYADQRIRLAVAIDPVPVDVLVDLSVAAPNIPVDILNFGTEVSIVKTANASHLPSGSNNITYSRIEDGSHFSLFGLCKAGAPRKALAMEIEEPICDDGAGRSREEIHREVIGRVVASFNTLLRGSKP